MQTQQSNPSPSRLGKAAFLAALLLAGVLVAAPAVGTFLLSFQDYRLAQGFSSPFVGMRNYQTLFQASYYGLSLLRTLQFSALSALTLLAVGTLAGYCLRAVSVRWVRHGLCTLLLVPLLVPGQLWAQAFFAAFSTPAAQSLVLLALWCGIKYVGLAALLTTAALAHGNRATTTPVLGAAVVALGLFALLGLQDYAFLRMLPQSSTMRDSMDTFVYRSLFEQGRLSVSACVTVMALALRAVLLAAVAWPVAALVKRLFPGNAAASETTPRDRLLSTLAVAALALAAAGALAVAARGLPLEPLAGTLAIYPVYSILAFVGAAVNTALCLCLARPVVTARQPALRRGTTVVLLALTALGAAPILLGGYLLTRTLGMLNTFFPVLLSGMGSTMGVWPLVFAARVMGVNTNKDWLRRMWRPALALMAVGAALRMNDALPSSIYLVRANTQHPLYVLSHMFSTQEFLGEQLPVAAAGALIALVTMAVPVVLLLLVRTVFTEREAVGLGLPMK